MHDLLTVIPYITTQLIFVNFTFVKRIIPQSATVILTNSEMPPVKQLICFDADVLYISRRTDVGKAPNDHTFLKLPCIDMLSYSHKYMYIKFYPT